MRWLVVLSIGWLLAGCSDPREWACHSTVKQLAEADPAAAELLMKRVVGFGRYALVDIEQQMHGAPPAGRMRLLSAIRRIGHPDALPLLRFYARWDDAKPVRERAREIADALAR